MQHRPAFPSREYERWFDHMCRSQARYILGAFYPFLLDDGEAHARIRGWRAYAKGMDRQAVTWAARKGAIEPLRAHRGVDEHKEYGKLDQINGAHSLCRMIEDSDRTLMSLSYIDSRLADVHGDGVDELLAALEQPRWGAVLRRRFVDEWSAAEVAREMSVSEARVYQIEKQALARLRERLPALGL